MAEQERSRYIQPELTKQETKTAYKETVEGLRGVFKDLGVKKILKQNRKRNKGYVGPMSFRSSKRQFREDRSVEVGLFLAVRENVHIGVWISMTSATSSMSIFAGEREHRELLGDYIPAHRDELATKIRNTLRNHLQRRAKP